MKNILIIQNNGNTSGGVWSVNKTLALKFMEKGYDVLILSIREGFNKAEVPRKLETYTINKKDKWAVPSGSEIKKSLKKFKLLKAFKQLMQNFSRAKDIKKTRQFIIQYNPDYIIASHYQVLDGIPTQYLKKTFNIHHSAFCHALDNKANIKTFEKYNGLVNFCWLSKKTMEKAKEYSLKNNYFVYNPVKFRSDKIADVTKNKKIVVLTRLSEEKRIDLMIQIVENIFKDKKYQDWTLEIYGTGAWESKIRNAITNKKQIILKEVTNDAKSAYLTGSLTLNTSSFEGFPMSILEANECGIPTVSFAYGESVFEQIIDGQTGFIIKQKDVSSFTIKLKKLMDDKKLLLQMSKACKKYNQLFQVDKIIEDWQELFDLADKK